MRTLRRFLAVSLALAGPSAAGCASRASSVRADQRMGTAGQGDAVVIGKLGFASRQGDGAHTYELTLVSASTGKKWAVDFSEELSQDGGSSAPFFVNLPPGKYALKKWEMTFSETSWTQDDLGLEIDVQPGELVCVGAMYVRARVSTEQKAGSGETALAGMADVVDECAALARVMRQRAPYLSPSPTVRLARPGG